MNRFTVFCVVALSVMVTASFVMPAFLNAKAAPKASTIAPASINIVNNQVIEEARPARMTLAEGLKDSSRQYEGTGFQRFVTKEVEKLHQDTEPTERNNSIIVPPPAPKPTTQEINPDPTWVEGF